MIAQFSWDRHAPIYATKPIADPSAYNRKLDRVRSLLRPTDHILEIGCGTGGTALRIAPSVAHVTATDISGEMVKIAKSKRDAEALTNIEFRQAAADKLVDGRPFDVICAFSVLHLVGDVPATLRQIYRQLKPGGLFISKTVCLKDRPVWMQVLVRTMTWLGYAPEVTALTRKVLFRYLNHAGFEILQSTYFGDQQMSPFIVARRPKDADSVNKPTLPSPQEKRHD